MRSNGATHIGNDTFLVVTRDTTDNAFLFTSRFPRAEQLAKLRLNRRIRLLPRSTLHEGDVEMIETLRRYCEGKETEKMSQSASSATVSSSSSSSEIDGDDSHSAFSTQPADGDYGDWCFVERHSLHASVDGHRVAAISNSERHHFLIDLTRTPATACEFITPELVRCVVWHPSAAHLLLVLLATGVFVAYDTSASHLGVVLPHARRVAFRRIIAAYLVASANCDAGSAEDVEEDGLKEDAGALSSNRQSGAAYATNMDDEDEDPAAAPRTSNVDTEKQRAMPTAQLPGEAGSRPRTAGLNCYGVPDGSRVQTSAVATTITTASRNRQDSGLSDDDIDLDAAGALDSTARPSTSAAAPQRVLQHGQTKEAAASSVLTQDVYHSLSSKRSTLLRPPEAVVSTPCSTATKDGKSTTDKDKRSSSSSSTAAMKKKTSDVVSPSMYRSSLYLSGSEEETLEEEGESAEESKSHRSTKTSGESADMHLSSCAVALRSGANAESALQRLAQERQEAHPTDALDLIDMCVAGPTRSMPPTLLLLSSSGDVFSVRLDSKCLPAQGSAVIQDGRLTISAEQRRAELAEARRVQPKDEPIVHHLLSTGSASYDEEALAIGACELDEDTGITAVCVMYSSGVLKGAWVEEPELIARSRVPVGDDGDDDEEQRSVGGSRSRGEKDRKDKALTAPKPIYTFHVSLGAAIKPRSVLSPAVPSTTHTTLLTMVGNVCLVRYDDGDAYVVAFPVWDLKRAGGGWSYYMPLCPAPNTRKKESLRLPLQSMEAGIPDPLAVRLPYDVTDASVALGLRDVIIMPEVQRLSDVAEEGDHTNLFGCGNATQCRREFAVVVSLAQLLRSAEYALCGGLVPTNPSNNRADGCAETELFGKALGRALDGVVECHRNYLCALPEAEVDERTALLAADVENAVGLMRDREKAAATREAALRARLRRVQERSEVLKESTSRWRRVLLDAIVHRRGPDAVYAANDKLGEIHKLLLGYEAEKAAARPAVQRRSKSKN